MKKNLNGLYLPKFTLNGELTTIKSQRGATIIIVLFVLILIIAIGTVAVRRSTTDLKISTAAQVDKLLFQTDDAVFLKIEKEDRKLTSGKQSTTLNAYMSAPERKGHSVSFCARPRSNRLFNILEISERDEDGNLLNLPWGTYAGFCDPSNKNDYVNEDRAITQLTFIRPNQIEEESVWNQELINTESNDFEIPGGGGGGKPTCATFIGYSTTVIPSLASVDLGNKSSNDTKTIAGCFKQPRTGSDTVDTCLTNLGVPFQTHVQVYLNQPVSTGCIASS